MKKALKEAIRLLEEEMIFLQKMARDDEFSTGPNFPGISDFTKREWKLKKKVAELKKAL